MKRVFTGYTVATFDGFEIALWSKPYPTRTVLYAPAKDIEESTRIKGNYFSAACEVAVQGLEECTKWFKTLERLQGYDL